MTPAPSDREAELYASEPFVSAAIAAGMPLMEFGDEIGFSLEHLRILAGPICSRCHGSDGEIVPATIREDYHGWGPSVWFCEPCHDRASEGAWESHCADFYGGTGPSDQDRFEARRDSGRRS